MEGNQAVALSLGFGHSPDDDNKTIIMTIISTTPHVTVYMAGNLAVAVFFCFGHSHGDNLTMKQ